jgi:hypothetical protein
LSNESIRPRRHLLFTNSTARKLTSFSSSSSFIAYRRRFHLSIFIIYLFVAVALHQSDVCTTSAVVGGPTTRLRRGPSEPPGIVSAPLILRDMIYYYPKNNVKPCLMCCRINFRTFRRSTSPCFRLFPAISRNYCTGKFKIGLPPILATPSPSRVS